MQWHRKIFVVGGLMQWCRKIFVVGGLMHEVLIMNCA